MVVPINRLIVNTQTILPQSMSCVTWSHVNMSDVCKSETRFSSQRRKNRHPLYVYYGCTCSWRAIDNNYWTTSRTVL